MRGSNGNEFDWAGTASGSTNGIPRKNILIIEDEQGILESLNELFVDDFNVLRARDGQEGLDLFRSQPVDAVILDLKLPGMEGTEVLKWIRRLSKTVPVIVVTAYSTIERAEKCADLMASGYIRKPFDSLDLLERVKELFRENRKIGNSEAGCPAYAIPAGLSGPIRESLRFINRHYTKPIRPKDVATRVSTSREHIGKQFKKEMGRTMDEHINWLRVEKSKQLLLESRDMKLFYISCQLGFQSEGHFLRTFKRFTGTTPTAFRKSAASSARPQSWR